MRPAAPLTLVKNLIEFEAMKTKKIYVAGHRGLVGSAIMRRLQSGGYTNLIGRTHKELDLLDQRATNLFFENERPEYVFLAAARVGGIHANNTYPADFIYENLTVQNNVIQAAHDHGVKWLCFLGSSCIYLSLGQLRYLSCIAQVDGVVGNSSSGLAEVPSFKRGTINIGDRQRGRLQAESIINCEPNRESITAAVEQLYSKDFQVVLSQVSNPYGEGGASEKIVSTLKDHVISGLIKKVFHDLPQLNDGGCN